MGLCPPELLPAPPQPGPWNARWPPLMLVLLPFQLSLSQGPDGGPARHRAVRMTPFWRMVGSKPLGAYCQHGLECSTKMCR
uniref:Uncharacterized protein n=1 Tax=Terrapene triunguis TaxID=2587831 RepID=A0A674IA30_9SAUR